jgi:hypothetical protein
VLIYDADEQEGTRVQLDFQRCKRVQLCADGSFAGGWRCDHTADCADSSDEAGCADEDYSTLPPSRSDGDQYGASLWPSSLALISWCGVRCALQPCDLDWDFPMRCLFLSRNIEGATDAGRLEANPSAVHGKAVLELGCGLATVSLAALKLGAAVVVATDGSLPTVENADYNVRSNHPGVAASNSSTASTTTQRFAALPLGWGDAVSAQSHVIRVRCVD